MRRDGFDHGFPSVAWDGAKRQALAVLRRSAAEARLVTYSELAGQISAVPMEAHDFRLAHFLGELSSEEHHAGRPLITALVVHKHDLQPGKGFYELARSLGYAFSDELEFWADQIKQLQACWR